MIKKFVNYEEVQVVPLTVSQLFMKNYVYVVGNYITGTALVVDPAFNMPLITKTLENNGWALEGVLITHHHFDHMNLVDSFSKKNLIPIYMSSIEIDYYDIRSPNLLPFDPDKFLFFQTAMVKAIHTPGHTFGGTCYLIENHLFTGDTIFIEGCGICQGKGASSKDMFHSFQKIKQQVNDDTIVYPGHRFYQHTGQTIDYIKSHNIYYCFKNSEDFIRFRNRKNQPNVLAFK